MMARYVFRAALAAMLCPAGAAAEDWRALPFGPPAVSHALDFDSLAARETDYDGEVTTGWFRVVRRDLSGVPRLVRKERHEIRCGAAETRLAEWGDFYPDGRLAAAGLAPATTPFKPIDLGGRSGHAAALWQAAC